MVANGMAGIGLASIDMVAHDMDRIDMDSTAITIKSMVGTNMVPMAWLLLT